MSVHQVTMCDHQVTLSDYQVTLGGDQVTYTLYKGMNEIESTQPIHNISSLHLFSLYVLHCLANSIYPTTRYHARLLKRMKNKEEER